MSQQWNPLQDLMVLQDRMNRLFEDATQRRNQAEATAGDEFERADWTPAADIYETETGYLIAIDLPGIDREALEIDVEEAGLRDVEREQPVALQAASRGEYQWHSGFWILWKSLEGSSLTCHSVCRWG